MKTASGYTLIEVLVSVAVFAVLSASAYVALDSLSRAAEAHRDRTEDFAAVQLAVARLDSDLRQLAARPAKSADGRLAPALSGESRRLEGTRAGWTNPAGLKRSTLQRFGWQQSGSDLQRRQWPVTDRVPATSSRTETVLDDIEALRFAYRDLAGVWHDRWPVDEGAAARLPGAVEVVLTSRRFGRIRRLVVLE